METRTLRWLTIFGPVGFWIGILVLRYTVFGEPVSIPEIIITVGLFFLAATLFSNWVFQVIDQREEEIHRRADQFEALNTALLALATELELGVVLQKVVDLSRELVKARFGALGVLDYEGKYFEQFITSGISEEDRARIGEPPQGHGLFGVLVHDGEPIRVDDIGGHQSAEGFPPHHPAMQSMIGVPIVSKGSVIGDIYLTDKIIVGDAENGTYGPFTDEDQQLLEMFANQAAIAIENARLYRQVQELAILQERERFGMDLHDGIIQSIYAVGLMLENTQRRIAKDPKESQNQITKAIHALNDVISDLRNYILDLRPQRFQGRNLKEGLEELARALRANTFMTVNLDFDGVSPEVLRPEQTVEILHIAQEALNNVRKHARATDVDIQVMWDEDELMLLVEDNGTSINTKEILWPTGDGLRNMRERATSLDGEILIGPREKGGTRVALKVPIKLIEFS
jgi:signal transduction histidine kinase